MASRVVPAISLTITRSVPKIAFVRELLPTLGCPIKQNSIVSSYFLLFFSGNKSTILSNKSPIPIPCRVLIANTSSTPKL